MNKLVAPLLLVLLIALTGAGIVYMLTREKGSRVFVQVEEIKKIAQLATVQARLSGHVLRTVEPSKFCKAIGCRNAYVFAIVTGTITGSVDLKQMKVEVREKEKTVRITFPKGSVLVSEPAIGKVPDVTPIETNVPNIISAGDKKKSEQDAVDSLKQVAKDMGIEKMTAQEAVTILTGFLKSLGYQAKIEFEDKSLEAAMSSVSDREVRNPQAKICQEFPGIPQCA